MRLVSACPVGCPTHLSPTRLLLPEGPLLRCDACGHLVSQVDAARYRASMEEFDDPRGTAPDRHAARRRETLAHRRVRRIAALLDRDPQGMRLLDVGCSSGAFLASARKLGCEVEGVEPAPQAAAAAARLGLVVHAGTLDQAALPAGSFDAVTLFEVIEHLNAPNALLREIHRVLRPGGLLLVGTGNTASWTARVLGERWDYFSIDRHGGHISFFNPGSLRLAGQRCGFELACIETRNLNLQDRFSRGSWRYRVAKIAAQLLTIPARRLDRGHDMLAFLRKPC